MIGEIFHTFGSRMPCQIIGRCRQNAMACTDHVSVGLEQILYRHLQIIGTVMKSRDQREKHAMVRRFREHWLDRFAGGAGLEPVVDSVFPLADAAAAHRRMESAVNVGKIILTMSENA